MAYPQHQGKTGPPRPGTHHGPPHHPPHPPPGSYGPTTVPPAPHGSHAGYGNHVPPNQHAPSGQRGPPTSLGPPLQNGPQSQLGLQIGPGGQHRPSAGSGQHGPTGQHGHQGTHGIPNQRGPPGSLGPPAPHKTPGPHGQYLPHIPHSNSISGQRGHPDGPTGEIRQPPAYPEPPRYPGPHVLHEEIDKHLPQAPPHSSQLQSNKQYPGPLGPGGGGGVIGGSSNNSSGGVGTNGGDMARVEEELSALNRSELLSRAVRAESEVRELKHPFHAQAAELRLLHDTHQRLTDDNQVTLLLY